MNALANVLTINGHEYLDVTEQAYNQAFGSDCKAAPKRLPTITMCELSGKVFPPVIWAVPGLLPIGCTWLVGAPKIGKSWLTLQLALSVGRAEDFLDKACPEGAVLLLALEDSERRLQERLLKLAPAPALNPWPANVAVSTEWERADAGCAMIRRWHATAQYPKLVIVDCLANFRNPRKGSEDIYFADYGAIRPLTELAHELQIAIVCIHHTNKSDWSGGDVFGQISGSNGLVAASDNAMILARTQNGVILSGRGRDVPDFEYAMSFDACDCRWNLLGKASEIHRTDERRVILEALLGSTDPLGPSDIAALTGFKSGNVRRLLLKMVQSGEISKAAYGKYNYPIPPGNTGNTDHFGNSSLEESVAAVTGVTGPLGGYT